MLLLRKYKNYNLKKSCIRLSYEFSLGISLRIEEHCVNIFVINFFVNEINYEHFIRPTRQMFRPTRKYIQYRRKSLVFAFV